MSVLHHKLPHRGPVLTLSWKGTLEIQTRIEIGTGARWRLPDVLRQVGVGSQILVVCQPTVREHLLDPLVERLKAEGFRVSTAIVADGEAGKSTDWLMKIWDSLQSCCFDRNDTVVAVGGGAVSDVAGFAASTYMRGLNLAYVPTSVLSQVDAAIGGKTAINLPSGKNLAGTFFFPQAVVVDPEVLATLPPRQFKSGLAEIIKYALIEETVASHTQYTPGPRGLFALLAESLDDSFLHDNLLLPGIMTTCIKMKLLVVGKDPKESGLRRCLNLGHTLAHALETVSGYEFTHGEAVSIGLVFALKLSVHKGLIDLSYLQQLKDLLTKVGLPVDLPTEIAKDELIQAMSHDKKRRGATIKFVLPKTRLGMVEYTADIALEEIQSLL
ncbi:MAG: 3-dehydroquinate synthase [Candidatus Melainabacteria bacterium]|nr:3-dehydroquinate synthase [Candidatus Melainabacteria bacterium]